MYLTSNYHNPIITVSELKVMEVSEADQTTGGMILGDFPFGVEFNSDTFVAFLRRHRLDAIGGRFIKITRFVTAKELLRDCRGKFDGLYSPQVLTREVVSTYRVTKKRDGSIVVKAVR